MSLPLFLVHAAEITETEGAADISQLNVVVSNFLAVAAGIAGMIAVVMIILGGFKYITSQGDPKGTQAARQTITWAIAGLALLIVGFFLLLLIQEVTGVNITTFNISPSD
jgi:hypothetical protein